MHGDGRGNVAMGGEGGKHTGFTHAGRGGSVRGRCWLCFAGAYALLGCFPVADVFEGAGRGDGGGQEGQSIFGGPFEDESFEVLHDRPGILGMANVGPHTNGSQFYVTKNAAPWLDQKKVAFGRVVTGMRVLDALEALPLENQRPVQPVTVAGCGEYAGPTSESKTAAKSE